MGGPCSSAVTIRLKPSRCRFRPNFTSSSYPIAVSTADARKLLEALRSPHQRHRVEPATWRAGCRTGGRRQALLAGVFKTGRWSPSRSVHSGIQPGEGRRAWRGARPLDRRFGALRFCVRGRGGWAGELAPRCRRPSRLRRHLRAISTGNRCRTGARCVTKSDTGFLLGVSELEIPINGRT